MRVGRAPNHFRSHSRFHRSNALLFQGWGYQSNAGCKAKAWSDRDRSRFGSHAPRLETGTCYRKFVRRDVGCEPPISLSSGGDLELQCEGHVSSESRESPDRKSESASDGGPYERTS